MRRARRHSRRHGARRPGRAGGSRPDRRSRAVERERAASGDSAAQTLPPREWQRERPILLSKRDHVVEVVGLGDPACQERIAHAPQLIAVQVVQRVAHDRRRRLAARRETERSERQQELIRVVPHQPRHVSFPRPAILSRSPAMLRKMFAPLLAAGLVAVTVTAQSPEKIDAAMNAKIRAEGMDRSQIMRIEHMLTDVYGPRLTGSPNHENAGKWAIKEMESWGMKNGKREPWNWGHEGWLNERADAHVTSPVRMNLIFAVQPWTPSTTGPVTAQAVNLVLPNGAPATWDPNASCSGGGRGANAPPPPPGPTQAELDAYFAQMAPKVKGAAVLVGAPYVPDFVETEQAKRRDDATVRAQYNPDPNAPPAAGRGNRGGGGGAGRGAAAPADPTHLTTQQVNTQLADFLMKNGAALRVADARERLGVVRQQSGNGYDSSKNLPGLLLRNEDYGRIARILH